MKTSAEPLYILLNRRWKQQMDKHSYETYGMSYDEHKYQVELECAKLFSEEEKQQLDFDITHPKDNSWDEIEHDNWITGGVSESMRRAERNSVGRYFADGGWFYGDY